MHNTCDCTAPHAEYHAQMLELGRWVRAHQQPGLMVDGRAMKNLEMAALMRLGDHERAERMERTGSCCDEGPMEDGHCRFGGMCPLVMDAERLIWRDGKNDG